MRYGNSKYDSDYIKKLLNEGYNQKHKVKPVVVKLPCKNHKAVSVEITEPRDQILVCPVCYRRVWLTWSKREAGIKIHER